MAIYSQAETLLGHVHRVSKLLESLVDLVTTLNARVAEVVERQKQCDDTLRRLMQSR